jgi:hypothetical protein
MTGQLVRLWPPSESKRAEMLGRRCECGAKPGEVCRPVLGEQSHELRGYDLHAARLEKP